MLQYGRRRLLARQLGPQLGQLFLHLGVLVPLSNAAEIGIDLAVQAQAVAAFARDVFWLLDHVTAQLIGSQHLSLARCSCR